jgi:hypothetical protein
MWGKWEKLSSTAGRAILAKLAQHADAPHAFGLLRARHERPRHRRAAEKMNARRLMCCSVLGMTPYHGSAENAGL